MELGDRATLAIVYETLAKRELAERGLLDAICTAYNKARGAQEPADREPRREDLKVGELFPQTLTPTERKRERAEVDEGLPLFDGADIVVCPKCKSINTEYVEVQALSAYEPTAKKCMCDNCGYRWKFVPKPAYEPTSPSYSPTSPQYGEVDEA